MNPLQKKPLIFKRSYGHEIDDAVLTITEKEAMKIEWPLYRGWLNVLWWFMIVALCVLASRVVYLNVIKGDYYQDMARRNSVRSISLPAPRGIISDIHGTVLVNNTPSVDLIAVPADLSQDATTRSDQIAALKSIITLDDAAWIEVETKLASRSLTPVLIKEHLTQEEVLLFSAKERSFPGMNALKTATRKYMDGIVFSHVIGYEGKIKKEELEDHPEYMLTDSIGKQGIEKSYESSLRGVYGSHRVEVDSLGKIKKDLGTLPPTAGNNLTLHIDAGLQKKIYEVLESQLSTSGLQRGAVIAMNPRNGGIMALVSYPSFDNNLFSEGITVDQYQSLLNDENLPLFNRAISGEYPPGSTVKPMLAAGALQEGIIDESTQIESKGGISVGGFFFGDWKVHGFTDVRRAIAVSSDVFFYSIGGGYGDIRGLGMDVMKKYYNIFGIGEKTGIDIGGESKGLVPDVAWKKAKIGEKWYIGDDYHASIGQGFVLATPLQMINAVAAIANGGTLYEPHIVASITNASGTNEPVKEKIIRQGIIKTAILQTIREGMRQTVTDGTASALKDLPVAVAGKTGTAEFGSENKTQGWFEAFAPYENPEIAIIALTEGQGENSYNAVPITKEILEWYFTQK